MRSLAFHPLICNFGDLRSACLGAQNAFSLLPKQSSRENDQQLCRMVVIIDKSAVTLATEHCLQRFDNI